jgi:integrase
MQYCVKKLTFDSGERFPMLASAETGLPLWNPNLYLVTQLRASNRASATLLQAARAIKVAYQVMDYLQIDPDERLAAGWLLKVGELDELVDLAGRSQRGLDALVSKEPRLARRRVVSSLEGVRMCSRTDEEINQVAAETKAIRMLYIRNYLTWLIRRAQQKSDWRHPTHQALAEVARIFSEQFSARISSSKSQNAFEARQGLGSVVRNRIVAVTHPDSTENPWKNHHVRSRNYLIFMWLLELGLRKGELLGVRLDDIDLRMGEVKIARRADDPAEPRRDAPNTKGRGRMLALGNDLSDLTREYVLGPRRHIPGARRSPYLLVATGSGKPLSKAALSKLFVELRCKVPGLPEELSPHVLRHTWNEQFSEYMDQTGVPPEAEERMRKQQMGWSDRSKMAAVYTRRHTRRKTNEASLAMQAAAFEASRGK